MDEAETPKARSEFRRKPERTKEEEREMRRGGTLEAQLESVSRRRRSEPCSLRSGLHGPGSVTV